MKITYLKLKNFKAIDVTLHIKELEIDFTRMVNPIMLLIGPIGSCKTYILSHLQPFAYMGNVDLRNGEDMIIEKKDGEKEIHFENKNGDVYKIHHYYLNKKTTKSIKSYIEKNGVELNPSGLVTKFNEIIDFEFGIDIGFLKILRLGTNVNNLVRLTHTNRKEFAVKLLNEIDEYINDYKNAVISSRDCNTELSIVVNKLKKIGNESADVELQNRIWELENDLTKQKEELENITKTLYQKKGEIESTVKLSYSELVKKIKDCSTHISASRNDILSIGTRIDKFKYNFVTCDIDEYIKEIEHKINDMENKLTDNSSRIELISQTLSEYKDDIVDINNKVKIFNEINEEDNIKKSLEEANEFDKKYDSYYHDFKPKYTIEEIKTEFEIIKQIQKVLDTINEYSSLARNFCFKAYNNCNDMRNFCIKQLVKLQTELKVIKMNKEQSETIMIPPMGCDQYKICPFYKAVFKDKTRSISSVENDIDVIGEAIKVCDLLEKIKILLDSIKEGLPFKVEFSEIVNSIVSENNKIFDFETISKSIAFLENYLLWKSNKERIVSYNAELEYIKKQRETVDKNSVSQQSKLNDKIGNLENQLNSLKNSRTFINKRLLTLRDIYKEAKEYFSLKKEIEEIDTFIQEDFYTKTELQKQLQMLIDFQTENNNTNKIIEEKKSKIVSIEKEIFEAKVKLNEFNTLKKQKEKLTKRYNETELVKNAVSSNKGIPLLYLNAHFGRARIIANRIIKEVCGDSIQIENIIINDKEFRIPYTKNNTLIPDVINASQGETSIISMALSFALIIGNDGYNILLLDEIDGPLDIDIKSHLLRMLEKRMESMNCDQIFMITHSPLFENYPVDVFVTKEQDNQLDSYKNINRIN